jgi:hypothetical protein
MEKADPLRDLETPRLDLLHPPRGEAKQLRSPASAICGCERIEASQCRAST